MLEQLLTSLMGTVDTMMVSRVGAASVSGVSCVDSINKLVIFMLTAVATGGAIVCSNYIGRNEKQNANNAARQVLLCAFGISIIITVAFLIFQKGLLQLVFGSVEEDVMDAAMKYFFVTILSYPFTAVFNSCAAIYRAAGNSRLPMIVSASCNGLNVIGNYLLLFVIKLGVTGAAISTTLSMVLASIIMLIAIERKPRTPEEAAHTIEIGALYKLKPDFRLMGNVLRIGIPTGIENSSFQLGKLVVQSTVATLGTMALTSNSIVTCLELITSMPSQGIGIGLMTVAGQCVGAHRMDETKKYIKKLTIWSAVSMFITNWLFYIITIPVCHLAGFDDPTTRLTLEVMLVISIVKPILWPLAFTPENGTRAAGDVNYNMIVSIISMWVCRVGLTTILCRFMGVGLIGIWCGYFLDWAVKSIFFIIRYRGDKWTRHQVIRQ